MQKRFLGKIGLRYLFYVIYMVVANKAEFPAFSVGLLIIIFSIQFCIELLKRKMLISPFLPAEVVLICFGLFKMNLVTTMRDMDLGPSIIIVLCIALWQFICCFNKYNFKKGDAALIFNLNTVNLKVLTYGLFAISAFCILIEWVRAGGIPILQSDAETFRFSVSFNSVWHIMAMSIKYVPVFGCLYWMAKNKISFKRDLLLLFVSLVSILFLIGTAQRGELLSAPAIIIFAYMIYKKPNFKNLIIPILVFVLIMGIYPIYRGYKMYGSSYMTSIAQISNNPTIWFLTPTYQTFAYSFHVLNRDFSTFPSQLSFGYGGYTVLCNIPFLDLHDDLGVVQNRAWNNNFYSELTPTFFGDWYADFGFFGCFLGITLICLLLNKLYSNYVKNKDAMSLALYAFNFYKAICMLYDNTFNFVWICYFALIWGIFRMAKGKVKNYE